MKVVCVDDGPPFDKDPSLGLVTPNGWLVKGESYTVLSEYTNRSHCRSLILAEKPIYFLAKWVRSGVHGWAARRFVPADYYAAEFAVEETEQETVQQPA